MPRVDRRIQGVASRDFPAVVIADDGVGMNDLSADSGGRGHAGDPAAGDRPQILDPEIDGDQSASGQQRVAQFLGQEQGVGGAGVDQLRNHPAVNQSSGASQVVAPRHPGGGTTGSDLDHLETDEIEERDLAGRRQDLCLKVLYVGV